MNMRFHKDWKTVVRHAWSFRLMCVSCILSGLSVALSSAQPYSSINPIYLSAASGFCTAMAAFSSLIAQKAFGD